MTLLNMQFSFALIQKFIIKFIICIIKLTIFQEIYVKIFENSNMKENKRKISMYIVKQNKNKLFYFFGEYHCHKCSKIFNTFDPFLEKIILSSN